MSSKSMRLRQCRQATAVEPNCSYASHGKQYVYRTPPCPTHATAPHDERAVLSPAWGACQCLKTKTWQDAGATYAQALGRGALPAVARLGRATHPRRERDLRIAFIMPWLTPTSDIHSRAATTLRSSAGGLAHWAASAAANSAIADFLLIHNDANTLNSTRKAHARLYPNIKYVLLPEMLALFEAKLGVNTSNWSGRSLSNARPAYGHVFAEFVEEYTHWGWADADVIYGDLGRTLLPHIPHASVMSVVCPWLICPAFAAPWVMSGQLTLFRNDESNRAIYRAIHGWDALVGTHNGQIEERDFADALLGGGHAPNVTFVVGQLNDQGACPFCGERTHRLVWYRGRLLLLRDVHGQLGPAQSSDGYGAAGNRESAPVPLLAEATTRTPARSSLCIQSEAALVHFRSLKIGLRAQLDAATTLPESLAISGGFELWWPERGTCQGVPWHQSCPKTQYAAWCPPLEVCTPARNSHDGYRRWPWQGVVAGLTASVLSRALRQLLDDPALLPQCPSGAL